jgi:hypothetical protein
MATNRVARSQNPMQFVSRTGPDAPTATGPDAPTATPFFADAPGIAIRQAQPLAPRPDTPPVDPTAARLTIWFTAFPVAKARRTSELRIIGSPERPHLAAFTMPIPATSSDVQTAPGSLTGPIRLVPLPRDQQTSEFDMLRTTGRSANAISEAAYKAALAKRGYRLWEPKH